MIHLFPAVSASAAGSLSVFQHRLLNTPSGQKTLEKKVASLSKGYDFPHQTVLTT